MLLIWAIFIYFLIITFRLSYLQIYRTQEFRFLGKKNFLRTQKITPQRGNIIDRHGNLLVTNRPVINISWRGTGNHHLDKKQLDVLKKLEEITHTNLFLNQGSAIQFAEKTRNSIILLKDVPFEQFSKLIELFPGHQNISIETHFQRFYPHKNLACHILGYLGMNIDGKMGLEKIFNHDLKGKEGIIIKTINSLGNQLSMKTIANASVGTDIQTTLDLSMQTMAEKKFPQGYKGTVIILNPQTGDILSIVSRPGFDSNIFLKPVSQHRWKKIIANQPFINRAYNACYPPASLFKLISLSAALEENIITPEQTWHCKGYITFGKRRFYCNNRHGHGTLTTQEAIAQSCNKPFFELGKLISIDILARYAKKFGLGKKTDILFSEQTGLVPTTEWKYFEKGERWWPGETISAVIGQSYLLTSPMQIARMIGGIKVGYLVKPRILTTERIQITPLYIQLETRAFLKEAMRSVVTQGTGHMLDNIKDIIIDAKTGTAQTAAFSKRFLGTSYRAHAWLGANFIYKDEDPLTLVILLENAGTAKPALQFAKQLLTAYSEYKNKKHENIPHITAREGLPALYSPISK